MGTLRLPGLIDVHVHLREPGGEQKEDMASGSAAALNGGVTMLLDMPNTYPPIVDGAALALKQRLAGQKALCDMGFYVGATETNALEAAGLAGQAVGLKIYLDQTYGPLRMSNLAALLAHFRTWPAGRPIAVHAEGLSAAIAIGLARSFGRRLHLCHVSLAGEIALVRAAKEFGRGADLRGDAPPPVPDRGGCSAAGTIWGNEAAAGDRGRPGGVVGQPGCRGLYRHRSRAAHPGRKRERHAAAGSPGAGDDAAAAADRRRRGPAHPGAVGGADT